MRRVLVIGAGGFIGRRVTRALAASGIMVTALDSYKPAEENHVGEWHVADSTNLGLLKMAAEGCDAAVFLGGYSRPGDRLGSIVGPVQEEIVHPVQVAEACADVGVQRFVFTSSGGTVYGPVETHPTPETERNCPINSYGVSKLTVEHFLRLLAKAGAIQSTVLRVSNPYGPGQQARRGQGFIAAAMNAAFSETELVIWGDGSAVRDFIYIGDVAEAFIAACRGSNPYDLINISFGEGASLREICAGVEQVSGRKLRIRYDGPRGTDVSISVLANDRAKNLLGWRPRTPLLEGLAKTAEWWASRSTDRP